MHRETIIGSLEQYSSTECGATTWYGSCSCLALAHHMSTTPAQEQEPVPSEEGSQMDTHRIGVRTYQELSTSEATPIRLATVVVAGYQFSILWTTISAIPTSARHLSAAGVFVAGGSLEWGLATLTSPPRE